MARFSGAPDFHCIPDDCALEVSARLSVFDHFDLTVAARSALEPMLVVILRIRLNAGERHRRAAFGTVMDGRSRDPLLSVRDLKKNAPNVRLRG